MEGRLKEYEEWKANLDRQTKEGSDSSLEQQAKIMALMDEVRSVENKQIVRAIRFPHGLRTCFACILSRVRGICGCCDRLS